MGIGARQRVQFDSVAVGIRTDFGGQTDSGSTFLFWLAVASVQALHAWRGGLRLSFILLVEPLRRCIACDAKRRILLIWVDRNGDVLVAAGRIFCFGMRANTLQIACTDLVELVDGTIIPVLDMTASSTIPAYETLTTWMEDATSLYMASRCQAHVMCTRICGPNEQECTGEERDLDKKVQPDNNRMPICQL
ncbi:hypothetical protein LZ32DRAFT_614551 [Colletotrichum eremochloae]|nr:hypothetical protein LZ32DRAFT_614551 [Colletotrichum eremochloae]